MLGFSLITLGLLKKIESIGELRSVNLLQKFMADLGLDASQETKITVMQLKIERLEEKQDELRERLKVVEKWVIGAAAVLAAGVTVIGFATNISKAYL
mgnify:CR=1 FL=1|jgi:cob(I)alamin adenosyltransferase